MTSAAERIRAKAIARLEELRNGQRTDGLAGQLPNTGTDSSGGLANQMGGVQVPTTASVPTQPVEVRQTNESLRDGIAEPAAGVSRPAHVNSSEQAVVERSVALQVTTELQPTALVVLERPATEQQVVVSSTDGNHEVGESTSKLDFTNPIHRNFLQRLAELEATLLTRDPLMKTHLKVIHETMINEEEIVNLLSVEEIGKIMAVQQVFTNTVLARDTAKASKAKNSSKAAQISMDDV